MLVLWFLLSCEEKDTGEDLSYSPPDPCADLTEEQCEASEECNGIQGWPLTETDYGYCYDSDILNDDPIWLICQSTVSSIQVETIAGPPDHSQCFLFANGTYPNDWIEDCDATIGLQCEE